MWMLELLMIEKNQRSLCPNQRRWLFVHYLRQWHNSSNNLQRARIYRQGLAIGLDRFGHESDQHRSSTSSQIESSRKAGTNRAMATARSAPPLRCKNNARCLNRLISFLQVPTASACLPSCDAQLAKFLKQFVSRKS